MDARMLTRKVPMDLRSKVNLLSKREIVTDKHWEDHLNGIEPSLGIIPINEDNECRWGCIDVDKYTLDHKEILKKVNQYMLPLWVCRSKSGGAHIFYSQQIMCLQNLCEINLCL